jgi:hypothetical protein
LNYRKLSDSSYGQTTGLKISIWILIFGVTLLYVLLIFFLHDLTFFQRMSKQGKGERKCNANWYVNMGVFCIFILYKEILANLHPSIEQAKSNIPDLVQSISQLMEYMMVDIDEDPEESFFQDAPPHLALQPTNSTPKFVLGSSSTSSTSQIKVNSSKQCHKKTCAACQDAGCKQRDSCKGSGNRKWCTCVVTGLHENQRDKFVYYIVHKYLENLCKFMQNNLDVDTTWNEILFYVV